VFSIDYRESAIKNWVGLMESFKITATTPFSLAVVLGDGVKI